MHANLELWPKLSFTRVKLSLLYSFNPCKFCMPFLFVAMGIYFFFLLPQVSVAECKLSLIAASGWGSSLVAVRGLLIAVASFIPEHGI